MDNIQEYYVSREDRIQETEREIYDLIVNFMEANRYSPSSKELKKLSGLGSTSTVHSYLKRLREKGLIDWVDKRPRSLRVIK